MKRSRLAVLSLAATLGIAIIAPQAFADSADTPVSAPASPPSSNAGKPLEPELTSKSQYDAGGATTPTGDLLPDEESNHPVTVIVELEEGDAGVAWYRRAVSSDAKRTVVKERIRTAVEAAAPGQVTSGGGPVTEVEDYEHVMEGFAIEVPAGAVEAVRGVEGVKRAFVEQTVTPSSEEGYSGPQNQYSLDMTGVDRISQKGDGTTIAIIDTGFDTTHEAFSGALDESRAAYSYDSISSVKRGLSTGWAGAYVSAKIPFAYDYGDGDSDVIPHTVHNMAHGTHVAGIAAANGGAILGSAPGAQLLLMKAGIDATGGLSDSAIFAALDDCAVLKPDVINMSFGYAGGASEARNDTYGSVYYRLSEQGIMLNVAGGNFGASSQGNASGWGLPYASDPDSSTVAQPSTYTASLSVASVDNANGWGPSTYKASSFSSWGVAPNLTLKPEIAAPGGYIWSALPGGTYGYSSGTSMATPYLAGMAADIKQRVESDPGFAYMTEAQKTGVVYNLLMGTAKPLVDNEGGRGAYYSPRKIGSGLANAVAASSATVFPTVVDAPDETRPKADLGDGTEGWTFSIRLTNTAYEARTYRLNTQALSEVVASGVFTQHSANWTDQGISVSYSGDVSGSTDSSTITVPGRGVVTATVTITPQAAFAAYADAYTPNGTFVDGFTVLTSMTEGEPDLSVPFLGFYGDWGAVPVFDSLASDGGQAHAVASRLASATTGVSLGVNPLAGYTSASSAPAPNPDAYVVSASTWAQGPSAIRPVTGLLRSTKSVTYTYQDSAGNTVRQYSYKNPRKSLYDDYTRLIASGESSIGDPYFDGYDWYGRRLPEGRYTLRIDAVTDGPSLRTQTLTYSFAYDLTGPKISGVHVSGQGEARAVSFDVTDSSPLASIDFHDPANGSYYYRTLVTDGGTLGADGQRTYHFDVPVADLQRGWESQGGTGPAPTNPTLYAWDYGVNASAGVTVSVDASDPISLSTSSVVIPAGETSQVFAVLSPSLSGSQVVWSLADSSVASLSTSSDTLTATITAGTKEGATTLTAWVRQGDGTWASASVEVSVRAAASSDFVIDEAGVLRSYSGSDTEVSVPGGVTALADRVFARSSVASVELPDTVERIGASAFEGAASLASVTVRDARGQVGEGLPSGLRQIGARAFLGTGLAAINVPDSVSDIGPGAFALMPSLTGVNIGSGVREGQLVSTFTASPKLKAITVKADNASYDSVDGVLFTKGRDTLLTYPLGRAGVSYTVPDGTRALAQESFEGAPLDEVTLPDSLRRIDRYAFVGSHLSSLTLPDSFEMIGAHAFRGVTSLTWVNIGGTTTIGESAFDGDRNLTAINFRSELARLTSIGANALRGVPVTPPALTAARAQAETPASDTASGNAPTPAPIASPEATGSDSASDDRATGGDAAPATPNPNASAPASPDAPDQGQGSEASPSSAAPAASTRAPGAAASAPAAAGQPVSVVGRAALSLGDAADYHAPHPKRTRPSSLAATGASTNGFVGILTAAATLGFVLVVARRQRLS